MRSASSGPRVVPSVPALDAVDVAERMRAVRLAALHYQSVPRRARRREDWPSPEEHVDFLAELGAFDAQRVRIGDGRRMVPDLEVGIAAARAYLAERAWTDDIGRVVYPTGRAVRRSRPRSGARSTQPGARQRTEARPAWSPTGKDIISRASLSASRSGCAARSRSMPSRRCWRIGRAWWRRRSVFLRRPLSAAESEASVSERKGHLKERGLLGSFAVCWPEWPTATIPDLEADDLVLPDDLPRGYHPLIAGCLAMPYPSGDESVPRLHDVEDQRDARDHATALAARRCDLRVGASVGELVGDDVVLRREVRPRLPAQRHLGQLGGQVSGATMQNAVRLGEALLDHALRFGGAGRKEEEGKAAKWFHQFCQPSVRLGARGSTPLCKRARGVSSFCQAVSRGMENEVGMTRV